MSGDTPVNDGPRMADLYCKAGGAAQGYADAGWTVVGVDIAPQPNYPFTFIQADALTFPLDGFDAVHASPPCQRYSQATSGSTWARHPDLVGPTRERLIASGLMYVIENVPRAPLLDPLVLCGTMFDLTAVDDDGTLLYLKRHRLFESNVPLTVPKPCAHQRGVQWAGSYGGARRDKDEARNVRHGGYVPSAAIQAQLLGIDWMKESEMYEAIPPAYTRHIGVQLLAAIGRSGNA